MLVRTQIRSVSFKNKITQKLLTYYLTEWKQKTPVSFKNLIYKLCIYKS